MTPLLISFSAALGTWLVYTSIAFGTRGLNTGSLVSANRSRPRIDIRTWLTQAGLGDVNPREFMAVVVTLFIIGSLLAYAVFGGVLPALAMGLFAASFPVDSFRRRRQDRRLKAQEAWPRMIEEMRVQTSSLGRSIPQALFDIGGRAPVELHPAFEAAHREWLLTTDLSRSLQVLKMQLADPTADMACETLLIAHELGGTDLDSRLAALADDRRQDVQGRKDAQSHLAGARFARLFVLIVPAGMALAGMSIGNGRAAYQAGSGQAVVLVALALVIGCWVWAGAVMRLPETERVFDR